ncbi:MAG: hypothetical protein RLZZ403_74 [Pseudomonadota bacterium]|jgi:hypothetical protein
MPVSKTWPSGSRRSNAANCDVCGVLWARNLMRRDPSGILRCPDDDRGMDPVSLDRANQAGVKPRRKAPKDPGSMTDDSPTAAEVAANVARLEAVFGVDL